MGKSTKRFSYLLLEEGEFYIQDWMAVCRSGCIGTVSPDVHNKQHPRIKGRLRLCSKSIFFEPDNLNLPIVMFPFNKVKKIDGGSEPLVSPSPASSKWSRKQEGFILETVLFVKMKERGFDMPYTFEKQESRWWFSLEFASVHQFLTQAQSLLSINGLPASERDMVLSNSMAQKEAQGRFDLTRLIDLNEQIIFDFPAAQITPLVREPGRLVLTQVHIYFQPLHNLNNDSPVRAQPLQSVITVARRRHSLRHIGLELFFTNLDLVSKRILGSGLSDGGSAFFTFRTVDERDAALIELQKQLKGMPNKAAANVGLLLEADNPWLQDILRAWQEGDISNYDYLLYLNLAAGRTFCDLTQWPVMPWILRDYISQTLDLDNPEIFRDLSKPIGALNAERLAIFKERYVQMAEEDGPDLPFLYGTHYSTPGYVLYWLVRSAPAHMLRLQNGRFDAPDRLFVSIADSWQSVNSNPADLKELIPEFFAHHGDFLSMREGLHLGVRQGGEVVSDVKLPLWCNSPEDFIIKHREALECKNVSKSLHLWIDLIFGFKQQGEAALSADNVFHHLTYEGSVDLDAIVDPIQRASLEAQINEFGQAPQQLFREPHPPRLVENSKVGKITSYSDNVQGDVFQGLNPKFLLQIMAAIPFQTDSEIDVTNFNVQAIASPMPLSVIEEDNVTSIIEDFPFNQGPSLAGVSTETGTEKLRLVRPYSARTDRRYDRMLSGYSECGMWDSWSPGSHFEMEYKEGASETGEEFHLKQGVESSSLMSRRLAAGNLASSFMNNKIDDSARSSVREDGTRKSDNLYSSHASTFKDQLSLSHSLQLHRGPATALILSQEDFSESPILFSAGQDGFVKVFSILENCQIRATRLGILPLSTLALARSGDKFPLVLAGSNDNCLYAYSADYDRPLGRMQVHEDTVTLIKYVDRLRKLITASSDATIKVWTLEEGRGRWITGMNTTSEACVPDAQFLEHEMAVLSFDVQEDSNFVVSGDEDGNLNAWDLRSPCTGVWHESDAIQGPITGIKFISCRPQMVVASGDGMAQLLDARKGGSCVATYNCKTPVNCIETSNETILAGSVDGHLLLLHADINEENGGGGTISGASSLQDHAVALNSISVLRCAPSLLRVATAADDGSIHVYTS